MHLECFNFDMVLTISQHHTELRVVTSIIRMIAKFFLRLFATGTAFYVSVSSQNSKECSPGPFLPPSGMKCESCLPGTYQPNSCAKGCIPRPDGFVNPLGGSVSWKTCGKWEAPNADRTTCYCKPGYGYNIERTSCKPCKPGSSGFIVGCWECDSGTYQPDKSVTSCLKCPQGTKSGIGASDCLTCANGESVIGKSVENVNLEHILKRVLLRVINVFQVRTSRPKIYSWTAFHAHLDLILDMGTQPVPYAQRGRRWWETPSVSLVKRDNTTTCVNKNALNAPKIISLQIVTSFRHASNADLVHSRLMAQVLAKNASMGQHY